MKKQYSKPMIFFEQYGLTQNIAGSCGNARSTLGIPTAGSKDSCGFEVDGVGILFLESMTGICRMEDGDYPGENESVNGYCWNAPTGNGIFGS